MHGAPEITCSLLLYTGLYRCRSSIPALSCQKQNLTINDGADIDGPSTAVDIDGRDSNVRTKNEGLKMFQCLEIQLNSI